MISRRDEKYAGLIAGLLILAGIAFFAVSSVASTRVFFIAGHCTQTSAPCESGSGTSTFVACWDSPLVGGNETGVGGPATLTSGVSNVLTQLGDVAAYNGTGRPLDGSNDAFTFPNGFLEVMLDNTSTWTLQLCMYNIVETAINDRFFCLRDDIGNNWAYISSSSGKLDAYLKSGASIYVNNEQAVNAYSTSGYVWITVCSSAAQGKLLVGHTTGIVPPTKLSQFPAGNFLMRQPAMAWPAALKWSDLRKAIFGNTGSGVAAETIGGTAVKVIVSNDCLIDFGS